MPKGKKKVGKVKGVKAAKKGKSQSYQRMAGNLPKGKKA